MILIHNSSSLIENKGIVSHAYDDESVGISVYTESLYCLGIETNSWSSFVHSKKELIRTTTVLWSVSPSMNGHTISKYFQNKMLNRIQNHSHNVSCRFEHSRLGKKRHLNEFVESLFNNCLQEELSLGRLINTAGTSIEFVINSPPYLVNFGCMATWYTKISDGKRQVMSGLINFEIDIRNIVNSSLRDCVYVDDLMLS